MTPEQIRELPRRDRVKVIYRLWDDGKAKDRKYSYQVVGDEIGLSRNQVAADCRDCKTWYPEETESAQTPNDAANIGEPERGSVDNQVYQQNGAAPTAPNNLEWPIYVFTGLEDAPKEPQPVFVEPTQRNGGSMEINSIQDLQRLVVNGFEDWRLCGEVAVKAKGDLLLFDYLQSAQYAARWNYFERISRGLIINKHTGEIVARPFDKFHNWMENGQTGHGYIVNVTEKLDGSLGILYRDNGRHKVSTRGSFDSDQALWATDYLNSRYDLSDLPDDLTLLFEIIYPANRVVVDYGDREDLVLLAARNRHNGNYVPFYPYVLELADLYGFSLPTVYQFNNIGEIIVQTGVIDANQEGWVVELSDGSRWKFKGDRYRELHKLITGLSFKSVLAAVMNRTIGHMLATIPDEFLGQARAWIAEIESEVARVQSAVICAFSDAPQGTRKDFALWVMANHRDVSSCLFALADGKDVTPFVYKVAFGDRM